MATETTVQLDNDSAPRAPRGGWLMRLAEGLDGLLSNFVGSAQIGPYVAPDPSVRLIDIDCPSCGQPISRHTTDHSAPVHRLYCPAPDETTG